MTAAAMTAQVQINWEVALAAGTMNGDPIPEGFTFTLGGFASGFDPSHENAADWQANFLTGGLTGNTNTWMSANQPAFPNHGFTEPQTANLANNNELAVGSLAYIWGYDSQTLNGAVNWILFQNPSWQFPPFNQLLSEAFDTAQAGTIAIVGTVNYVDGDPISSSFSTEVIPEPSTYALIFGLGILGFLGYRRVRK